MLNVEPSFRHHRNAYGRYAEAVHDYVDLRIMDWMGKPQFTKLKRIQFFGLVWAVTLRSSGADVDLGKAWQQHGTRNDAWPTLESSVFPSGGSTCMKPWPNLVSSCCPSVLLLA